MVHVTTRELQDAGLSRREAVNITQRDYDTLHMANEAVIRVKTKRQPQRRKEGTRGPIVVRR